MFERQTIAALAEVAVWRGTERGREEEEQKQARQQDYRLTILEEAELKRLGAGSEEIEDIYALSPMQQGLLFHSLYEPGTGVYFNQLGCRMEDVEVEAFQQAWGEVVQRHPILRSGFVWEGVKEPVQVVKRQVELRWREEDWRGMEEPEQRERWKRYMEEERGKDFDLREAPVMRLALMRVGEKSYYFGWSNHHVVMDGWCRQVVIGEVFSLYEGYRRGERVELKKAGRYRDYIGWLKEQREEEAEGFWREELKGFKEPTRLGIEKGGEQPALGSGGEEDEREDEYGHIERVLSKELTRELEELGRQQQVTLNTIVQGAWGWLLQRYSGERDVVFGATVSGRSAAVEGIESMVGLFINTLPVRLQGGGEERVGEYLKRLQEKQAEARQYEWSPLVKVQQWSEVGRGRRLFEYILVFENYPVDKAVQERMRAGMNLEEVENTLIHNTYGLTVRVSGGEQVVLEAIYERGRFEDGEMERMVGQLGRVLEEMGRRVEGEVKDVEMLSKEEKEQVVVEWNRSEREYGERGKKSIVELMEEAAERSWGKTAVVSGGKKLSYGELEARGNQLGRYLQRLGVGAEVKVGLCMERGVEMMVGLVGILKAGGAYVALEGSHPQERLRYMVEDAGVKVVLTEGKWGEKFRGVEAGAGRGVGVRVVRMDEEWEEIGRERAEKIEGRRVAGENLAYVIYTSGSTGRPKGVGIEQRQIVNYVLGIEERLGLEAGWKYALVSTVAADLGNTMIYGALVSGGELHVLREEEVLDGEGLGEYMEREKIDCLKIVPSHLVGLRSVKGGEKVMAGKVLVVGGEASQWRWVEEWERGRAGKEGEGKQGCRIVNHYGPTETTVGVLTYEVNRREEKESGEGEGRGGEEKRRRSRTLALGKPLGNARVYVLDEEMKPVGVGIAGELYIGGRGVGRGYEGRPEQTAERFVPDPFAGKGMGVGMGEEAKAEAWGGRLYRTGDRVRWDGEGNVEFLGRVDEQVKVRGYRIEVGEIEARMNGHEGVEAGVVVVREEEGGEKRLVGYVVWKRDQREHINEHIDNEHITKESRARERAEQLREHLRQYLPEYMVPAVLVEIEELPLTSNGKVNRRELAERKIAVATREREYGSGSEQDGRDEQGGSRVRPKTEVEEVLSRVWGEVLGRERVGVEENFFEIGGDSILSIQAVARGREAGVEVTPRQMFERQTIAALAEVAIVKTEKLKKAEQGLVSERVQLTPIQAAFFSWKLAYPEHYNQAVLLELKAGVESERLERTVEELLRHHDGLRMRYERNDETGEWEQWFAAEMPEGVYRRRGLSGFEGREQEEELERDAAQVQASLKLETGELVRVVEYELGARGRRLLVVIHHLVVDGVSWRILLEDLERGYEQLAQMGEQWRNGKISLGEKSAAYGEWSERLKEYSGRAEVKQELEYWAGEQRKDKRTKTARLPLDGGEFSRAENVVEKQGVVRVWLEEEQTRELLQEVHRVYHTQINDVLLTALVRAVGEWSGSGELLVDVEGHGREEIAGGVDVGRTVGWFTTIYPVVLKVEGLELGRWEAGGALKAVKEQLRRVPQRGLGYGLLRYVQEDEGIRRELEELGEAEIRFNYLGQVDGVLKGSKSFGVAGEKHGGEQSGKNRRRYVLDVNGMVVGGRLQMSWSYGEGLHKRETIEKLAERYMECVRELIEHCRRQPLGSFTPSDFPLANLEENDLEQIAMQIAAGD
jgi:amino acid adenylation domain-containing protein/non-ribosomal peptide synthase protein (TIGR01720 family)